MVKPVNKGYITSPYGNRILDGVKQFHPGIDIGSKEDQPIIVAYRSGTIKVVGFSQTFGWRIWIKHDDGVYCVYAHMAALSPHIKEGDYINEGTNLGIMGNTGLSKGRHLHIELRTAPDTTGKSINPLEISNLYTNAKLSTELTQRQ